MKPVKQKQKIVKYFAVLLLIIWLIVSAIYREELNDYLSAIGSQWIESETTAEFYSQYDNTDYELKPGEILSLPVHFDGRLGHLGIYLGAQPQNKGNYIVQLENESGYILGKNVVNLNATDEAEFVPINIKGNVTSTTQYYIKIYSESFARTSLWLKVSPAAIFGAAPFSVDNRESEYTLILEESFLTARYNQVLRLDLIFVGIVFCIWILCANRTRACWRNRVKPFFKAIPGRKVYQSAIALLVIGEIITAVVPYTEQIPLGGNTRRSYAGRTVDLDEGVVIEQYAPVEENGINVVSVRFASYAKRLKKGTVHLELWDHSADMLLFSDSIKAKKIRDNEYSVFKLSKPLTPQQKTVCLRLWAEGFSEEEPVALHFNNHYFDTMYATVGGEKVEGSMIFELAIAEKAYRTDVLILLNSALLITLIVYIWKFLHFKKTVKYMICSALSAILLILPALSFLNYGEISLNGMSASMVSQDKRLLSRTYDAMELEQCLHAETEYDFAGRLHARYEQTELLVNGAVSDIILHFPGSELSKDKYDIKIYWDTGKGYNEKQSYKFQYVHRGKNSVSFLLPCIGTVKSLRIDANKESGDKIRDDDAFVITALPDRILPLTALELNTQMSKWSVLDADTGVIFACIVLCALLIYWWKSFKIDEKIAGYFFKKGISISAVFVIVAIVYGTIFAFLIPTHQVPDEGSHVKMLYTDLGAPDMQTALYSVLEEQKQKDIATHSGQTLEIQSYISASKKPIQDYSFQYGFPSILVLRRPGQALGVMLGQVLRLPAYWILQLGELCALAVYIIIGAFTLKLIPIKKNVMMMIMLLPIAIQEAGSFSYDSFTNALSFLAIGYILHLKIRATKITWRQVAALFFLAMGLLLGKIIYVLLLFLVFIIPVDKLELRFGSILIDGAWIRKHRVKSAAVLVAFLFAGIVTGFLGLKLMGYGNIFQLLTSYITDFPQLLRLCIKTTTVKWRFWIGGITINLGWLDMPFNEVFVWLVIISAFLFALFHHGRSSNIPEIWRTENVSFSAQDLFIWYGVCFALYVVVLISMIGWAERIHAVDTLNLLPVIEGVQGRYFIPMLPLVFIPIHTKRDVLSFIPSELYKIFYYAMLSIYPISLLLVRYWGIGHW